MTFPFKRRAASPASDTYRPRLTWLDEALAPEMGAGVRCYTATVGDGRLRVLVRAPSPESPVWMMQVEHHHANAAPMLRPDGSSVTPLGRRPTLDELIDARAHALPHNAAVAVLLQPSSLPPHVVVATQIGELVTAPRGGTPT